jgi:hypothetical protein
VVVVEEEQEVAVVAAVLRVEVEDIIVGRGVWLVGV